MRGEGAVRVLLCDRVHVRRRAFLDGVALQAFLGSDTPTIMHAVPVGNTSALWAILSLRQEFYMRQTLFFTCTIAERKWAEVDGGYK